MRFDLFGKLSLAAIAIFLGIIALRPWFSPDVTVRAQGAFTGMQFAATPVGYSFFDSRTGELWEYSNTTLVKKYRIVKPGQPLVKEQ
jgi:hypothetical protein